ncbi:MAG: hypothetical protein SW833_13115 [Cyanobacteriota bacterium]|nr:hypothetical protein [Cyanobacteriota bacterium]
MFVRLPIPQQSPSRASVVRSEFCDRQSPSAPSTQTTLEQQQKEEMKQLLSAVARGQLRLAV